MRSLLVQGAISAITLGKTRTDRQLIWPRQLMANKGLQKAAGSLANNTARVIWSVMAKDHDHAIQR